MSMTDVLHLSLLHVSLLLLLLKAAIPARGQLLQPLNLTGYVYQICNGQKYDSGGTFSQNLNTVIGILTKAAAAREGYHLANSTEGSDNSSWAYAAYQCRGDLSANDCNSCVGVIASYNCGGAIGMRIQLAGCYLRYEQYAFANPEFGVTTFNCSSETNGSSLYQSDLAAALNRTADAAPINGGFAASKVGTAYALSQCYGYLSPSDCATCLSQSSARSPICNTSSSGYFYYVACFYLFSDRDFLFSNSSLFPAPPPALSPAPFPGTASSSLSGAAIAGISVGSASALLLTVAAVLYFCILSRRRSISLDPRAHSGESDPIATIPPKFLIGVEELEAATENFHARNKLGQGGFGVVYKGTLRSGKEVAIKTISRSGNYQGNGDDFLNEAKLITTVQHRNLIQLLGCAMDGGRWYLVYEYFPNRSLDLHLFGSDDEARTQQLDWKTRYNIIKGIARGLRYLHEDSAVRIVHRDIKSSNILLDGNLEPKIADFGLARLFAGDISHLNTAVAGTLGYVAPEYAMGGRLSEKVDVYSFGLVTLEIVSGRKAIHNNAADPEQTHLLQWAWGLYERKREVEMVDRRIPGGVDEGELARVVQVALLCTQANPQARPSMSEVYTILHTTSVLHIPSRPGIVSMGIFSPSQNHGEEAHRGGGIDGNPAYHEERRWNSRSATDVTTSTTYTMSSGASERGGVGRYGDQGWTTDAEWSRNEPDSAITELLPR